MGMKEWRNEGMEIWRWENGAHEHVERGDEGGIQEEYLSSVITAWAIGFGDCTAELCPESLQQHYTQRLCKRQ